MATPYTLVTVAEIVPHANKALSYIIAYGALIVGQVYSCVLALLFMDSVSSGNWKLVVIFVTFPAIIASIAIPKYLLESPKLLLQKNRIDEAVN